MVDLAAELPGINLAADNVLEPANNSLESGNNNVRFIVIGNLPTDVSAAQALMGVKGHGLIQSITMVNAPKLKDGMSSAVVEFNSGISPRLLFEFIKKNKIYYRNGIGKKHLADIQEFSQQFPDYQQTKATDHEIFTTGRVLKLPNFPKHGIWWFLERCGTMNIIDATLRENDKRSARATLVVEFTSFLEAGRALQLIESGSVGYYNDRNDIQCRHASSDFHFRPAKLWTLKGIRDIAISHIPVDHIAEKWDTQPWNSICPTLINHADQPCGRPTLVNSADPYDRSLHIDTAYAAIDESRTRNYNGRRHTIVSCDIRVYLENGTWAILEEHEVDWLRKSTLGNPLWSKFWDLWYENNHIVDQKRVDTYAMTQRHHRDAQKKGKSRCECKLCDIKKAPVPAEIQRYLSGR
ncbi:hypothetical protein BGZ63DRAFT_423000 [Mariannaea sp. PMI_226]|nr:hypothetical protein BGZ63DRAFT_423000 [Mariannaea sp. PMI_226]